MILRTSKEFQFYAVSSTCVSVPPRSTIFHLLDSKPWFALLAGNIYPSSSPSFFCAYLAICSSSRWTRLSSSYCLSGRNPLGEKGCDDSGQELVKSKLANLASKILACKAQAVTKTPNPSYYTASRPASSAICNVMQCQIFLKFTFAPCPVQICLAQRSFLPKSGRDHASSGSAGLFSSSPRLLHKVFLPLFCHLSGALSESQSCCRRSLALVLDIGDIPQVPSRVFSLSLSGSRLQPCSAPLKIVLGSQRSRPKFGISNSRLPNCELRKRLFRSGSDPPRTRS
jgi:hypothetical protein